MPLSGEQCVHRRGVVGITVAYKMVAGCKERGVAYHIFRNGSIVGDNDRYIKNHQARLFLARPNKMYSGSLFLSSSGTIA